jgi:type II secretory pathway pseudopilin PulG
MVSRNKVMRQRGYNLVMLIMAVTVLNIMVAVSLPMWSEVIQRDREEELISRGFQYAEAMRVFKNRFQRDPVRLEELMEVKPRCIRRLWKDPMTDGKFVPLHPDQPQLPGNPQGQGGGVPPADPGEENPEGTDPGSFNPGGTPKGPVSVGPIVGVRSSSTKKSFLVFTGKEHYNEWRFTVELLTQGRSPTGRGDGQTPGNPPPVLAPGGGMNLSTRWLGRPLPAFLQPPEGGLPGGQPPVPGGSGLNPGGGKPGGGGSLAPDGKNPADSKPRGRNGS